MNRFRGPDAIPEIEYVLELPADRATIFYDELTCSGVSRDRIKVVEPGSKPAPPPPVKNSVDSKHKRPPKSEKTKSSGGGGRQRRQPVSAARFLPKSIKLGTCCRGQYDVSIHRRPVPEGRESVCISMAAKEVAAAAALEQQNGTVRFVAVTDSANRGGRSNDDDANGVPITVRQCRCAGATCDEYRNALLKYSEESRDGNDHGEQHVVKCVYEQIADVLWKVNADNGLSARVHDGIGGDTSGNDDGGRVQSPSVEKTSDKNDDGGKDNIDHEIDDVNRLTGGGNVAGEPCSVSDTGHSLETVDSGGNCCEIDRQILDNARHQQVFSSSRTRFFEDSANGFLTNLQQLRHRSGDRSTTALESSGTGITSNETVEQSRPTEMAKASEISVKRTKKTFLDRLLWRGINSSRNDVYQPTDNDATVKSGEKAATVVRNKAKKRTNGREVKVFGRR